MMALVSRPGRQSQRYNDKGRRLVVGSIPYRYKNGSKGGVDRKVEVLVISPQKGQGIIFPKGGWELGESVEEAARRETLEEAGAVGIIQRKLGSWRYKSKSQNTYHQGSMYPLLVTEQLDLWPEKHARQRLWMDIEVARELCRDWWMKEALERLMERLAPCSAKSDQVDSFLEFVEDQEIKFFLGKNLISWSAKQQPIVARSNTEVEYCDVANAVAKTCWLRSLFCELGRPLPRASIVCCDNVSAVYLTIDPVQHQRTKHIEINIRFVRNKVSLGHIRVLHGPLSSLQIFSRRVSLVLFFSISRTV